MPTLLKHLTLDRIDVVDDGANQGARITLFKRNKETRMPESEQVETPASEPVELLKRLADAEAAHAEIAKRLKAAEEKAAAGEEEIAKLRDRQEREDAIAVAKRVAAVAPVDDLAEIVRTAKRAFTPEVYAKFESVLTAAQTRLASGKLFAEIGKGGDGAGASSADKLDAMVKQEVLKRDGKATYAMVYADLTKSNPEARALYEAIQKEGR